MWLPELVSADKRVSLSEWAQDEAGRLHLTLGVEDRRGVTVEGLFLRARARRALPDRAVMFQLEYRSAFQPQEPLCRIEWRPIKPHNNYGRGPQEFRFRQISGSHHHKFTENWDNAQERMLRDNLPIAVPILPDPRDFHQLIALVSKEFRITNLGGLSVPPWDLFI